jgi:type I restriction enzyme, S subunit
MNKIPFVEAFKFEKKSGRKAGDGRDNGNYPFYSSSSIQNKFTEHPDYDGPALIFGTGGKACIHYSKAFFSTSGDCLVAKPKHDRVNTKVIYYFLSANIHLLEAGFKGAGLKHISKGYISELLIPYLPTVKQNRIETILDKADAIRRKRQQAIQLYDEFLRSVFLDMFGDPVINTKKWPIEPLESFCSDVVDCPHSTPKYSDDKTPFPCLRSSDLQDGHLVFETTKYVDENIYRNRIARIKPMQGDIIYCREGARLGNLAIVPEGLTPCLGQRTMLFRANQNEATPNFLLTLLNNNGIKNEVSKKIIGAAAPRVNVKDLKEFQIIKPPLAFQQRYEKIALKYHLNRQRYLAYQQLSNQAFNSLTQHAFRGEL